MNILAIDTSNEYLALGILTDKQFFEQQLKVGNRHSQTILPEIDNLLKMAQLEIADLGLIAYNYGPGAFTGLRIGLGCTLGLSYSIKASLAAVPAFMLYSSPETLDFRYLGVCLDARLNQVYFAIIDQNSYNYLLEPCLLDPACLYENISKQQEITPENFVITGMGIKEYQEQLDNDLFTKYHYHYQEYPSIKRMLELVKNRHYQPFEPNNADLMYVRNKVALNLEEQKQNKQVT